MITVNPLTSFSGLKQDPQGRCFLDGDSSLSSVHPDLPKNIIIINNGRIVQEEEKDPGINNLLYTVTPNYDHKIEREKSRSYSTDFGARRLKVWSMKCCLFSQIAKSSSDTSGGSINDAGVGFLKKDSILGCIAFGLLTIAVGVGTQQEWRREASEGKIKMGEGDRQGKQNEKSMDRHGYSFCLP